MDATQKRALIDERIAAFEVEPGDVEMLDAVLTLAERAEGFSTEGMTDAQAARAVIAICREVFATLDTSLGEGATDRIFEGMRRTVTLAIYAFSRFAALVRANATETADEITELLTTVEDASEA